MSTGSNREASSPIEGLETVSFVVPEMDCPSCAKKIASSVQQLAGIEVIDPEVTTGTVYVEYDPSQTDTERIVDRIEAAGYTVETQRSERTDTFDVPDMDCPSCAGKIENALDRREGVLSYDTQPTTGTVVVTYDPSMATPTDLVGSIEGAGYPVEGTRTEDSANRASRLREDPSAVWWSTRALKVYTGAAFLALGLVVEFLLPSLNVVLATGFGQEIVLMELFYIVGIAAGGETILRNGYYSARNLSLDIDLLMSLGVLGAVVASFVFGESLYFEGGTLAVLFSFAQLMERYSMGRARRSLDELIDLAPETATVRRDGDERTLGVDDLRIGDVVVVRPGEKIPMDGEVIEGESAVNQAPITGESVPVDKTEGNEVYAGTINEEATSKSRSRRRRQTTPLRGSSRWSRTPGARKPITSGSSTDSRASTPRSSWGSRSCSSSLSRSSSVRRGALDSSRDSRCSSSPVRVRWLSVRR